MVNYENKNSLTELLDAYCEHLSKQGKSHRAIITYKNPNNQLVQFLAGKGVSEPQEVTEELLKDFQKFLYAERDFMRSSVMFCMQHIRMFFDFLIQIGKLTRNEARGIEIFPKQELPPKQLAQYMASSQNKDSLSELLDVYGEYLSDEGKSRIAVLTYQNPNRQLIQFLTEKGVTKPQKVTGELLNEFQKFLYAERDFKRSSVMSCIKHTAMFFDFLIQIGRLKRNEARGIEILPKPELPEKQLSHFYTYDEILKRYLGDQEKWVSYFYLHQVEKHLKAFIKYLLANEIGSVYPVTESTILKYRQFLWDEFVHARADSLVVKSQINRLRCVVRLFRYLSKEGISKNNPTKNLGWEKYYKEIVEKAKSLPEKPVPENNLTELDKLNMKFLEYELAIGKDKSTIKMYKKSVEVFFQYLAEKGVENLAQVNKRLLLEYYTYLCNYVGARGNPVSNGYKNHMLWSMRLFFRFLVRFDYLPKDPSLDLESIKEERGLPRTCMNEKEVFELLEQPRLNHNPLIARDKAMMEILFSTGIRSNELCSLNLEDIDHQQEMVRVNSPKGGAE